MAKIKALNNTKAKLSKSLVLNRWVLSQFGVDALESLADAEFKRSVFEGYDSDNNTHFHQYLISRQFTFPGVTKSQLIAWDQHIVSHTMAISEKRDGMLKWKYFQYLTLLFTELYLERYFSDKAGLLKELNEYIENWNDPFNNEVRNGSGFFCEPYTENELNKIAFWSATGSGKTLLMHVNILQYRHYLKLKGDKNTLNKIILVTPKEGLSLQHLSELNLSGIDAEIFSKQSGSLFSGKKVEIIEVTKLKLESGDKSVAIESFETNNLVLVDEGHTGLSGDEFKSNRDYLSENGFAFEYSATFGQAVSAASGKVRESLTQEYSKSILMDYSYKYFYQDGYGKDYNILNVPENRLDEFTRKYLTGALLAYYQQHRIFNDNTLWVNTFNLHMPLWVFVGGSVNAVRKVEGVDTSDVLQIISFFAEFIQDPLISKQHIAELLNGTDGIVDKNNLSVFTGRFNYLKKGNTNPNELYNDILKVVFHAETAGSTIYVDQLKGQDGELGIRVGDRYFGVINVGDEAKLFKLCQDNKISGESKEFTTSLFQTINNKDSKINLLIGSKKFTEGWSSWRVSTMGLMNIGRSEGSQIIQLFGRGVRLKGFQMSLKRSPMLDPEQRPDIRYPANWKPVETLQIFGIRADYMQIFKEFLEEEGLPANDSVFVPIEIPVMLTADLGTIKLKVLQVEKNVDFKHDVTVDLKYDNSLGRGSVKLEWYPRVQMLNGNSAQIIIPAYRAENKLTDAHLAFVDWAAVYFELQQFKNERAWYNLNLSVETLQEIINHPDWYDLSVPEGELTANTYRRVKEWQAIVTALLKGYTDRFYNLVKAGYLGEHMETVELTPDHPNFMEKYQVEVEQSQEMIIDRLADINTLLKNNNFTKEELIRKDFSVFQFLEHLYKPLIYMDARNFRDIVKISPVSLVESEYRFVNHLKAFYEQTPEFFKERRLYLLRNASRKGVGFFEAHGFYPDFILWLVENNHQYISFVDPKGLRQINGFNHPKMTFYKTIKDKIENRIREKDKDITLNSFIVSPTTFNEVSHWQGGGRMGDFNEKHVYFMNEQKESYIELILRKVLE